VHVPYGTDLDTLMPRLTNAVAKVPRVIADPSPGVSLEGFGANGLELSIGFWIRDPENGQGNVKSDVNLVVLRTLGEAGVEIPYPQRVVRNA
jgi:small-conductance mechanosensitive channel